MSAVLFYTVGLPGAGKTTFATSLAFWLGVAHLRGDKIGLELFRFPTFSPQERAMVHAEMAARASEQLRAGKHVIYDAAVNTRAQREALVTLAQQQGTEAIGILLDTPIELAKKRAGRLRDMNQTGPVARIIPPHIFDQYAAAFELPNDDEAIAVIAGDACFALQYRRLTRQLQPYGIGFPRII